MLTDAATKWGKAERVAKGDSKPWRCPEHPNAGIREVTGKWKPPKPAKPQEAVSETLFGEEA